MKCFIVLLSLIGLAACAVKYEFLEEWNLWKDEHGKNYGTELEEIERHIVWLSNKKYIEQHNANADIFGFTLAMNHFGDTTEAEFIEQYCTYKMPDYSKAVTIFTPPRETDYPSFIDWNTYDAVTRVKNQSSCGASYAFSATGAMEGAIALSYGTLVSLSEQNIIDCSSSYGNNGCHGGNMYNSFLYVTENEGIDTESSYPYYGSRSKCKFSKNYVSAAISGIVAIKTGSESDLLAAVVSVGPISVAVDARPTTFKFYSKGVYSTSRCSSSTLNHAMLITGYGSYYNKDYWLVKNSWGTDWGNSGYIQMTRNSYNQCGIATDASYPTL